jgi:ATP-dependent Clp protease ATP-binding subunit ClpC
MVVEVQLAALLAGVSSLEELDARFNLLLTEARNPGIVLFFDELRTITPAGHDGLTLAISNQLKPEIARGAITCIVSGAEDDYHRFVELDGSLRPWFDQWFQPIRVDELTPEATLEALDIIAAHTEAMTGISVQPSVLKWIVSFAGELLKSHRFPGKAVDLLEQCVAHAISRGSMKVTMADAREVAERAIAIPADMDSRLRRIGKLLSDSGLLLPEDEQTIVDRLSVSMRSLDLVPATPNATILMVGETTAAARALAETLADAIAGSAERVIPIDFAHLVEPWDARQLVGVPGPNAPPGTDLPLRRLLDEPWSVILGENIDACHAQVRSSLTRALSEGYFVDARGKKIYMSDAVVILTAPSVDPHAAGAMGFGLHDHPAESDLHGVIRRIFDAELMDEIDLVIAQLRSGADLVAVTRQQSLLADLTKRYRSRGLDITWDKSIVDWFGSESQQKRSKHDWELWADKNLASALIPHLPPRVSTHLKKVVVKREGDALVVGQTRPGPSGKAR